MSIDKKANSFHSIGAAFLKLDQFEKGMEYLNKNLQLNLEVNNKHKIAKSYTSIAEAYLNHDYSVEALQTCDLAMEYAAEFNDPDLLIKIYEVYSKYYQNHNNYKKSYEFYTLGITERNKSSKENNLRSILQLQKKIEMNNIERNAKIKEQEEALKGSIAMAITANHHINQPLTVLQGNVDLINSKLEACNMSFDKTFLIQIQEMIEEIQHALHIFKKNNGKSET
ncbi:MAG TPA: hypothetical protein PL063_09290 [Candidatus Cloacimonadota bacterium]|jgi:tetratricopeptide (TPR) repeat protein|nr:hypothetical protein [Candidatus Cloacimonadales bacterium]HPY97391.1 hypothetical protein [Candidatus Cloacimonadota bacterium]HQB41913.1 hypothetical protein [Candidatus Cloacimonadota bacterium]